MYLCNELVVVCDEIGENGVYGDLSKRLNLVKFLNSDTVYIYESKEKLLAVMSRGAKTISTTMRRIDDMYDKYTKPMFAVHKFYGELRFTEFLHNNHIHTKNLILK